MKDTFFVFLLMLGLCSCGVTTSSSDVVVKTTEPVVDTPDPDVNTTVPDVNSTVPDINTTIPDNNDTVDQVIEDPVFDPSGGAEVDLDACKSSYATAVPLQDHNENDDRESSDDDNGLAVMSFYTETGIVENSNVIAFYKTITQKSLLKETAFRENLYGDNSRFRVEYDLVWTSEPNNIIYIQVPKMERQLKSCFRMTINSQNGASIVPQKVYR